jgi:hypothetical protein
MVREHKMRKITAMSSQVFNLHNSKSSQCCASKNCVCACWALWCCNDFKKSRNGVALSKKLRRTRDNRRLKYWTKRMVENFHIGRVMWLTQLSLDRWRVSWLGQLNRATLIWIIKNARDHGIYYHVIFYRKVDDWKHSMDWGPNIIFGETRHLLRVEIWTGKALY